MRTVLAGAARVLRPGGYVAMTVRPWWRDGRLIDLPGAIGRVGEQAGLVLYERNVALLAGLRGDRLVPRSSFFTLDNVRKDLVDEFRNGLARYPYAGPPGRAVSTPETLPSTSTEPTGESGTV